MHDSNATIVKPHRAIFGLLKGEIKITDKNGCKQDEHHLARASHACESDPDVNRLDKGPTQQFEIHSTHSTRNSNAMRKGATKPIFPSDPCKEKGAL